MLSEDQVKRILEQCKRVDNAFGDSIATGAQTEQSINQGWIQALKLVLKESTYPIRKTPLTIDDFMPIDDIILSNCCNAPFSYPGWPESDMCSACNEHADTGGNG